MNRRAMLRNNKTLIIIFLSSIFLSACAGPDENKVSQEVPKQDQALTSVQDILSKAEGVYAEAKALEHSWTVTAKHIKSTKESLAAGHTEAALVSAERALLTAEASLAQANKESKAWKFRALSGSN